MGSPGWDGTADLGGEGVCRYVREGAAEN